MQKKYILLLLLLAAILPSCKDEYEKCDDDPQCEYFYCEVNGEKWEANCESATPIFGCSPYNVQYYKNNGFLESSFDNDKDAQGINLISFNLKVNFANSLTSNTRLFKTNINNCQRYLIDTTKYNYINIELLDTVNFILKGNFSFQCKNDCEENLNIQNGRFKVHYRF